LKEKTTLIEVLWDVFEFEIERVNRYILMFNSFDRGLALTRGKDVTGSGSALRTTLLGVLSHLSDVTTSFAIYSCICAFVIQTGSFNRSKNGSWCGYMI